MADLGRHTFSRTPVPAPVAVGGCGVEIWDATGKRYLDGSGGAVVVGIGHGSARVKAAVLQQLDEIAFVHPTQLVGSKLDSYTEALARFLPFEDCQIYPVSGGSDAVEGALKLARCYHLGRGDTGRDLIISRWDSYHGNTRGALDVTGRRPARAPYQSWLGLARHQPSVNEYRCPLGTHPLRCGRAHADLLEQAIIEAGPDRVAAFIAEPIGGATLAVAIPPEDYWSSIAEVCRRHGVLLILDEVMTGFGRTGRWFAAEHWDLSPDILVTAKGVCSGYWPMGLICATNEVHEWAASVGFPHGGTFSHSAMGSAIALAVLEELCEKNLVEESDRKGSVLLDALKLGLSGFECVGDIRGRGLFSAVEIVQDPTSRAPFSRTEHIAERITAAALTRGLVVYPSTACAGETGGDAVILAPPFVVTESELSEMVELLTRSIEQVVVEQRGVERE